VSAPRGWRRLTAGGVLAVSLALVSTGCKFDGAYDLPLPGGIVSDKDSYTVKAEFADVLSVVPRTAVMVDDVPVGEVKEVDRIGWHAELTLWVRNDVQLPDNALAEIRQTSLLGEKYVALLPPTDEQPKGQLSDGDVIELDDTGRNPEVEEVLGALSFLLSGGGVGQLATITHELNAVMDGRQGTLRSLLSTLDGVIGTLDDQKSDIIAALTSLNNLTATLNAQKQTIGDAVDAMAPAVEVLSAQHKNLVAMLRALDRLGYVGTRVIGASKDDLLATLRELEPVLDNLNKSGSSIGTGLSLLLSFPFPKESNNIVHGDFANTIMQVNVTLQNLQDAGPSGIPSLPLPSLPLPSVPLPSLGLPSLPLASLPLPSLGLPSLPISGLPREQATTAALTVSQKVATCAEAGSILDAACGTSLATTEGFHALMVGCRADVLRRTPVCRSLNLLPLRQVSPNTGLTSTLDTFGQALTGAFDTPLGDQAALYSGGDV
jgi:phospholipid/cholesterol/gamma-HCH transport system substrate-binding protein